MSWMVVEDRQPQGSPTRLGEATRVGNFSEQNRVPSNERHHRAHGAEQPGDSEWDQGYGYQFWRGQHGTYRCDGAFAQLGIVLPTRTP